MYEMYFFGQISHIKNHIWSARNENIEKLTEDSNLFCENQYNKYDIYNVW